ncbi:MAG: 6-phosphogluconolactonase [Pararhodobacter sp.]|nr:6-phosphogluconolactonase [Pararhodobacter sp.]
MELIEYADTDMMMISLAGALSRDLRAALGRRERAVFCVPGGTTPGPVFDMLAAVDLNWANVDIVLSDERFVPEDHARSNAALVRGRLLQDRASAARLIPMWRRGMLPEQAASAVSAEIAPLLPIDVALLGMGVDMHTASLFPDAPRLDLALADDAPPVMALDVPGQPEPRLTLTAKVLRKAFALHLVITGADKRAALARAEDADPLEAPVAALLGQASVHWAQ